MGNTSAIASELAPQFVVLGFLRIRPMHGYNLHRHLQADLHELWHISQSQSYAILKRLEKRGWVAPTPETHDKRHDRIIFHLSEEGKSHFDLWLSRPTASSTRAIRVEFLTRLFFASQLETGLAARLLQEQIGASRRDLARLERHLEEIPGHEPFNRLGLQLRIRQLITAVEWLQSCEPSHLPALLD